MLNPKRVATELERRRQTMDSAASLKEGLKLIQKRMGGLAGRERRLIRLFVHLW